MEKEEKKTYALPLEVNDYSIDIYKSRKLITGSWQIGNIDPKKFIVVHNNKQ
jgi:hypothetical protein